MGVIRFKIWRDLWINKGRTLAVVLIIGLGAAAVGMIVSTRNLTIELMSGGWRSINPPMISLFAFPPVGDDTISVLQRIEGLEDVEGYASTTVEWRLSPEDEWRPAGITARASFPEQSYGRLELIEGDWPGGESLAVSRSSASSFGRSMGLSGT